MSKFISTLYAIRFVRLLSTPFEKWDAYKLGLIDKDGELIRKSETDEEKLAMSSWNNLIRNMKKSLNVFNYNNRIKSTNFFLSLSFLKENVDCPEDLYLTELLSAFGFSDISEPRSLLEDKKGTLYPKTYSSDMGVYSIKEDDMNNYTLFENEKIFNLYNSLTREYDLVTETFLIESDAIGNTTTSTSIANEQPIVKRKTKVLKRNEKNKQECYFNK